MTNSAALLIVSAVCVAGLLAPALALFFAGVPTYRDALLTAGAIAGTLVVAAVEWMALGTPVDVAIFQGAIAAVAVAVVLAVGLRAAPARGLLVFVALWLVVVLVPVGYAVFDVVHGPLASTLGTLDFGGGSVVGVSTGTAALALALVSRRRGNVVGGWPRRGPVLFTAVALTAIVGWIAINVGSELVFDATADRLVVNELLAAGAGIVGWLAAQILNVRSASVAGIVAGITAGSVVTLPASPWLDPGSVVVLGVGAGILGHVSTVAARRIGTGRWATVIGVLLVPAILGYLAVGVVAIGSGLIFSGHADLLLSQAAGLLAVLLYSFVGSLLLAVVLEYTLHLTGTARAVDETIARLYRAYNARDTAHVLAAIHPDVQWPNANHDGYLSGKDALLAYWKHQWAEINPIVTPVRTRRLRGGLIRVDVHQVITDRGGAVQSDEMITHTYRERNGLLDRMEIA